MNPARKRKLVILVLSLSVVAAATALVLYALNQNINLFYSPSDVASGQAPLKHSIRVGGMVEKGSFVRAAKGLGVTFKITDYTHSLKISHTGILPDLFREEQGVVVEGQLLDNQNFQAERVLAKHDANYMPPEVKAALANKVKP